MKRPILFLVLFGLSFTLYSQQTLSLDSCRKLAIRNNKALLIGSQKIEAAHYTHQAAKTNYLPKLSATASYLRNQKEISLLSDEQKNGIGNIGSSVQGSLQSSLQQIVAAHPELAPIVGALGGIDLSAPLNAVGQGLVDALRTDTRNMYLGALTLKQPIFMGGKIRAYNKITQYAEQLATEQQDGNLQDVILETDQTYWQVISLVNKKRLADGYLQLLQKLESDVVKMVAEGVATRADELSIKVKVNEAEMTLTRVEDGLSLSRMLLCQLCGLSITDSITLSDEAIKTIPLNENNTSYSIANAIENRPEIKSLRLANEIYQQKVKVVNSEHLPHLALVGNYLVTNPSVYNSFENKFRGMWSVGVMLQADIWSWGEGRYKVKAAKAEANIARFQLAEAKEKIELQINQAGFKVNEANRRLSMAVKNKEKAEENLRIAMLGFQEGVIAPSNVLEAHTAWLSAQSDLIDSQIDVKLTDVYLKKTLGTLK